MKNNRGFTLVELLVVMVIFGIVIGLSFPAIKALQEKNMEKKFTTYKDSLTSGAKIYADSYDEDLFGRKENGCVCIKLAELESKKLAKDITIKDVTCETDNSFVRITKADELYTYSSFLGCKDKSASEANYIYPKSDQPHTFDSQGCNTLCNDEISNGLYLTANPPTETKYTKSKSVRLYIESVTGINQGIEIYSAWSTSKTGSESLDNYKRVRITAPQDQKKKIAEGDIISTSSSKISTPSNKSGTYYLHVRVDRLYDLYDATWKQGDGGKYLVFGPYNIDNEPPVINEYKIKSSSPVYNAPTPDLLIDVEDNITSSNDIRVCVSVKKGNDYHHLFYTGTSSTWLKRTTTGCAPDKVNDSDYIKNYYKKFYSPINLALMDAYGTEYPLYFSVIDEAGNHAFKDDTYKTAVKYKLSYDLSNGEYGDEHPTTAIVGKEFTVSHPSKTVKAIFDAASTGATISYNDSTFASSGSKVPYNFAGWTITGMDTTTHTYGNTTSTAKTLENIKETTFKNLRGTDGDVKFTANWEDLEVTLPTITKAGNDCGWATESNGSKHINSGGKWKFSGALERTFTAECRPTIECPTVTSKVGNSTYTKDKWTNKDIKFTFGFGNDITSYDWYMKKGTGNWENRGVKDASETTQTISDEGEWSIRLVVHDNWGATKTCEHSSYKIDKTAPASVPIKFSLDSDYGTGNRGTYDIPAGSSDGTDYGCNTTDYCGRTFTLRFMATDDSKSNGVKSGIAYYEHTFKGKCYDPTNTRERGSSLIGINGQAIRCNLAGSNPLYSIPDRVAQIKSFTLGSTQELPGYYNGHAGYWPAEYSGYNSYIGMSVGVEVIVAVDNAGNRSPETYIKYKSCTSCKNKTRDYYHINSSAAETKTP